MWQKGLPIENMTSNLFMYDSGKVTEKFLFEVTFFPLSKTRHFNYAKGTEPEGVTLSARVFWGWEASKPLDVVAFSTFQVQDNTQGFYENSMPKNMCRLRDSNSNSCGPMFYRFAAFFLLWFFDLRRIKRRINLAQINFFSVMFEWMPLLPSPFPETETFDPSARWLCTKIKHFLYFYFTPSLSLISMLDCSPFILFKTFLLYPPRCLEKEERMVCCEIGWRKYLSALFSSGE